MRKFRNRKKELWRGKDKKEKKESRVNFSQFACPYASA